MAGPELEWVDYEVSLAAPTARHVRSLTTEQAAAPELELRVAPPISEVTIPVPNLSAWPSARDEAKTLSSDRHLAAGTAAPLWGARDAPPVMGTMLKVGPLNGTVSRLYVSGHH